jgi:hypothetical protein
VIEMRVREHDGVELLDPRHGRQPVGVFELLATLEKPTIDEDIGIPGLEQVRGPCHFTSSRAKQRNLHGRTLLS